MSADILPIRPDITNADCASIAVGDRLSIINLTDADLVAGFNWRALEGHNGKIYAYCRPLYMHRLIAGTPPGMETDHINGDGLDNRRANLRTATASQNRANMGKPKVQGGSSSQYKGVFWEASRGKWRATIGVMNRTIFLGRYATEKEAAAAYDIAAQDQWGPFAQLNFPDGVA